MHHYKSYDTAWVTQLRFNDYGEIFNASKLVRVYLTYDVDQVQNMSPSVLGEIPTGI